MKSSDGPHVAAIVVTFNRCELLLRCLDALSAQQLPLKAIVIVDNASTDDTQAAIVAYRKSNSHRIVYTRLDKNLGGAGGFAHGVSMSTDLECDWLWLMDDDAEPHLDALDQLMDVAKDPRNVYGSLATNGNETAWTVTLVEGKHTRSVDAPEDVPKQAPVRSLPFLGFLIHRSLVNKIGPPDAGFFIAADDIEYCVRAQRAGAQIFIAGNSHIKHPKANRRTIHVLGNDIPYLSLPPWKRYYDTRNRLLVARKYYGIRVLTQTVPGSFVRLYASLRYEPRKMAQLWSFIAGIVDGLLGIKGRRHHKWWIRQ